MMKPLSTDKVTSSSSSSPKRHTGGTVTRFPGGLVAAFRPFATPRLRYESHGILARELLTAVRRRLSLDETLEAFSTPERRIPRSFWNLLLLATFILVLFAFSQGEGVGAVLATFFIILMIVAFGATLQFDDYRRHVGYVLSRELRRGRTLGEAFDRHPELFSSFETTLMRAGERNATLDRSLEIWSRHCSASERLGHTADMAIYPVLVASFLLSILLLFSIKILPRFEDVWNQLAGSQEQFPTVVAFALSTLRSSFQSGGIFLAILFLGIALFIILPRRFFNGSVAGSVVFIGLAFLVSMNILEISILKPLNFWDSMLYSYRNNISGYLVAVGTGVSILFSVLFVIGGFRLARWFAGRGSERVLHLLSFLPVLHQAEHRMNESKFLYCLQALLHSGEEFSTAVEEAGVGVGRRRWIRAAQKAATAARQGQSPSQVFHAFQPLNPTTRSRLAIADFDECLLTALLETAEEDQRIGTDALAQFNAFFFPLVHFMIGCAMAFYLVLLYVPILYISQTVAYGG